MYENIDYEWVKSELEKNEEVIIMGSLFKKYGDYLCNNKGVVLSLKLNRILELKQFKKDAGYYCVVISGKELRVHRIVGFLFVKGRTKKRNQINHIDGVKTNNHYKNLEWCTLQENIQHSVKTGLFNLKGEQINTCKLKEKDIPIIRKLCKLGISRGKIAKKYSVNRTTIEDIFKSKTWKHIK